MTGDSRDLRLPAYSQRTQEACPRCEHAEIDALPPNIPGSDQEWFRCRGCDHMWAQRRDRTEQGNEPAI